MTVCTNDVALGDLRQDARPAAIAKSFGDVEELVVPAVIELEHERVELATVGTRVSLEVSDQEPGPLGDDPPSARLGGDDVLSTIGRVVLAFVFGATSAAVVVPLAARASAPRELIKRLRLPATTAAPGGLTDLVHANTCSHEARTERRRGGGAKP
jgi:hypothetical protein